MPLALQAHDVPQDVGVRDLQAPAAERLGEFGGGGPTELVVELHDLIGRHRGGGGLCHVCIPPKRHKSGRVGKIDEENEDTTVALSELSTTASTPRSFVDEAQALQERWADLAAMAESAQGLPRLEAVASILPRVPDGPHGRLLERELVESLDLPATLRFVKWAGTAMARLLAAIQARDAYA